jgi:SMC interacting uncharacterized protein involved in chromosome segregation
LSRERERERARRRMSDCVSVIKLFGKRIPLLRPVQEQEEEEEEEEKVLIEQVFNSYHSF